jgi:DNA polymerase-3 subunit epsilon
MKLLSVDLETTGLDIDTCEIIEIGYTLHDTDTGSMAPVLIGSQFVLPKETLTEEVKEVTGIADATLQKYGVQMDEAILNFINVINQYSPDFIVGHNLIDFDVPIIRRYLDLVKEAPLEKKTPIIDTRIDLPFKRQPKYKGLTFLAAEYAKFANPFAHRAVFDCLTTMKLLESFDLGKITVNALSPLVHLRADVSFQTKDLVKNTGYSWNPDAKIWEKKVREAIANETERSRPFPVLVVNRIGVPTL